MFPCLHRHKNRKASISTKTSEILSLTEMYCTEQPRNSPKTMLRPPTTSNSGMVALTLRPSPSHTGPVVVSASGNAGGVLDVTDVGRSLSTSNSGNDGKSVGANVVVMASVDCITGTRQVVTVDVFVVRLGTNVDFGNGAEVVDGTVISVGINSSLTSF